MRSRVACLEPNKWRAVSMDLTSSAVVKEVRWWWGWVYQPVLGNGVDQLRSKVMSTTVLIVNFVFGWLLCTWMTTHHDVISAYVDTSMAKINSEVVTALVWLDDWPVGLKLNTPLSHFFSVRFQELIRVWQGGLPTGSTICAMIESGLLLGLSPGVALMSDLVSIVNLHVSTCYWITHLIFTWQKSTLHSLWNLFRGKRWNVLRKRTDSYEYEVDQLFLGTLLFTVSAFLFPTVLTYHLLFAGLYAAGNLAHFALSLPVMVIHRYTT